MRKVVLCEGNNKMVICMEDCVFMKEIKTNVMRILDKERKHNNLCPCPLLQEF